MRRMAMMTCAVLGALALEAAKVASVTAKDADGADASVSDVLVRCRVKAGDEYDPQTCAKDARALRDAGEYDDIRVEAVHGADGIDVTFVVKRKMRFHGPLNARGNDYWNEGKIAKLAELKDGYAYGEADFAAAALRIKKEYQKKFFSDAEVKPVVEKIEGLDGAVSVTMEITEGPRKKIHEWAFEGAEAVAADDLRASFDQFPWWNPKGWFSDEPCCEQEYAEARDKVAAVYRDRGYLDVRVSLPEERPYAEGLIDRVFTVEEGPLYHVGAMAVTGVKNYPEEAVLAAAANLKTGDVAGAAAIAEAAHQIEVFCGSGERPLAETQVAVRQIPSADDPGVVDLTFVVKEGVPVRLHDVVVRGNDYTQDKVIRREISLSPGDPMLADKAERSKKRLENLRYFERVRYYLERPEGVTAKPGEPEPRDLVYELAEKNTGNFMIGAGASSVDSVFGTIELSESNFDLFSPWRFRGAGQKGRISLSAGPRVQIYEASVTEPYFLDRTLEFTTTVYRRQRWFDDYDVIRSGFTMSWAYPVKFWPSWEPFGRLGVSIGAEFIEFEDVENDWGWAETGPWKRQYRQLFKDEEDEYGDAWETPFELFWMDDTRDKFLFATRGHRIKLYGDLVGGDNAYWKLGVDFRQYWNVWKKYEHVLSFHFRGATEDTFSDDMPIYDRLFLGGPRSIRGVDYREIGPRMWKNEDLRKRGHHAPWGGQTSWCGTFEYTVPVVKMVRVAAFTDFGSVGADDWDFDTDYFCWTVGVGLRLDIEQFPIRLDFAVPVDEPTDTDDEVFSFSIGSDF